MRTGLKPGRPWLTLALLAVVVVAVPASALERFDDVADGNTHRDAIAELVETGITVGCADGSYCPDQLVRRDQMASFLTRSAARATSHHGVAELSSGDGVPASVTVQATGGSGGRGMVALQGAVTVYADTGLSACPCEVEAFVYRDSDDAQGPSSWSQLPDTPSGSGRAATSVPVQWTVEIPSGSSETFRLAVFLDDAPSGARTEASLTAVSTPLG